MCPLKDRCPKVRKKRWPDSGIKTTKKFGELCPYAHHLMELEFPETVHFKIAATDQQKKKISSAIENEKPNAPFRPQNPDLWKNPKGKSEIDQKNDLERRKKNLAHQLEKMKDPSLKEYQQEMKQLKVNIEGTDKKIKFNLDENFCKKFGSLKKASVLAFYGRTNEAFSEIAKAADIVKQQKVFEAQRAEAIQRRWKFKLGLDEGFELPFPIEKVHPDDVTNKMLGQSDAGVPVSTCRMYLDNVSPFRAEEFSKNAFINDCIEELYVTMEGRIQEKIDSISTMKKQVEKLDEIAEMMEMFGEGEVDPAMMVDANGDPMKIKPQKSKMCKTYMETKKCKDLKNGNCKFAHNPIELTGLIPVATKIKNLNGVIQSQSHQLKKNKVQENFVPGGVQNGVADPSVFEPYRMPGEFKDEEEKDDEKPKSIFERENVFKKPFEAD